MLINWTLSPCPSFFADSVHTFLNLGCTLESPGNLFKILISGPHALEILFSLLWDGAITLVTKKQNFRRMRPRNQDFKKIPQVILMCSQGWKPLYRAVVLKLWPLGHMQPTKNIYPAHRVFLPPLPVLLSSRLVPGPQCACVECLRDSELAPCLKSLRTSTLVIDMIISNNQLILDQSCYLCAFVLLRKMFGPKPSWGLRWSSIFWLL